MERELWPLLYQVVWQVGRQVCQKCVRYRPWIMASVILWAALHDRPRGWAGLQKNWSTTHRIAPHILRTEPVEPPRRD
jgi:hypothetical protein